MARCAAIFGLLAALISFAHAGVDFDYLMFTQEWPPTFCARQDCNFPRSEVTGWNIHGLWPSNYDHHNPEYCKGGQPFDYNKLAPIKTVLQKSWADLKDFDSPAEFWSYEWKKHGRCGSSDPLLSSELKFFNTSVQLKLAFNMDKVLASHSIVPSDDNTYQVDQIRSVLKQAYGVNPGIRCSYENGQATWIETRLCVDARLKPIDCPDEDSSLKFNKLGTSSCSDEVSYPTFDTIARHVRRRLERKRWSSGRNIL